MTCGISDCWFSRISSGVFAHSDHKWWQRKQAWQNDRLVCILSICQGLNGVNRLAYNDGFSLLLLLLLLLLSSLFAFCRAPIDSNFTEEELHSVNILNSLVFSFVVRYYNNSSKGCPEFFLFCFVLLLFFCLFKFYTPQMRSSSNVFFIIFSAEVFKTFFFFFF